MRYSLRTLLILVTLVAIILARVGYLKRMAQIHKVAAERFVAHVTEYRQNPRDCVAYLINCDAARGKAVKWWGPRRGNPPSKSTVHMSKSPPKVMWLDSDSMDAWEKAVTHKVIAARYDRAVYRPWTRVSEVVE